MKRKLIVVFNLVVTTIAFAQIELVKDINEGNKDSFSTNFITYKNQVYFTASQNFSNYLFKYSNGIVEVVKDQNNNEVKSSNKPLEFNGMLYLNARINNVQGAYAFDGDNFTLLTETYFYKPQVLNNKIFFYNQFNSFDFTLWSTDGTQANTNKFLDIQVYSFLGTGYENMVIGNKLFFVAKNSESGRELWVTDGSVSGTKLVKDINPGASGSDPKDFFSATDGKMYFTAETTEYGRELYVTDGTENGTFMLKDFYEGTSGGDFYLEELNSTIFITKKDGTTDVLFSSDGTTAGTNAIDSSIKSEKLLKVHNGLLFFEGALTGQNENLLVTDGTLNGTRVLKSNLNFESLEMFPYKDDLYFRGNEGDDVELWKTDGTESGTTKVIDIDNDSALDGSFPFYFSIFKDELYFVATQFGNTGTELWKTDGTESGTQIIQDLTQGAGNTMFFEFYPTANELLINLEQSSDLGRELYKYVGSNTASVSEFKPNQIQIYFTDQLYVKGLKDVKASLKVYDIQGKEIVYEPQISSKANRVSFYASKGVYIVNLFLDTGELISKKIIIQ